MNQSSQPNNDAMRYFLNIVAYVAASLAMLTLGWGFGEIMMAEVPTPIIVAGCAGCVIVAAAVVLAALKVISNLNKNTSK